MVLNYEEIMYRCSSNPPLIENINRDKNKNNPAKIELCLGKRCYCSNNPNKIQSLEEGDSITIEPNEVFLFQTLEKINMPKDLVGNISLKMGFVAKGLLMPSQTQIDPGYRNYLYGMFYNLSSDPIKLSYGDSIVTVEFRLTKESSIVYSGQMENISLEVFLKKRITCSLGSIKLLKDETNHALNRLQKITSMWNTILAAISVTLAVLTAIITLNNISSNNEANLKINYLEEKISSQTILLESYKEQLSDLEEKYYQHLVTQTD